MSDVIVQTIQTDVITTPIQTSVLTGGTIVLEAPSLGFIPENVANKVTDLSSPDNIKYPSSLAVSEAIDEAIASVPTALSGFTNDTGFITIAPVDALSASLSAVAFSGSYTDLSNTPTLNFQPIDSDLTAIAAITPVADNVIQYKSGAWTNRTPSQLKADLSLVKSDVGLSNVDNTSDANKPVSTATQTALNAKFNNPTGTTSQYIKGDGSIGDTSAIISIPKNFISFDAISHSSYAWVNPGRIVQAAPGSAVIDGVLYSWSSALSVTGVNGVSPLVAGNPHVYVYLYYNGSSVALELSATAPTYSAANGYYEKTGDSTRRLIGWTRNILNAGEYYPLQFAASLSGSLVTQHFSYGVTNGIDTITDSQLAIATSFSGLVNWQDFDLSSHAPKSVVMVNLAFQAVSGGSPRGGLGISPTSLSTLKPASTSLAYVQQTATGTTIPERNLRVFLEPLVADYKGIYLKMVYTNGSTGVSFSVFLVGVQFAI